MSKTLEQYRAEHVARVANGAGVCPIDAELTAELARFGDTVVHLGGEVLARQYRRSPDAETVRAAWRGAETHFRATGEVLPAFSLCDGTIVRDLDEARAGLQRAEKRLSEIARAEADLAAALREIDQLRKLFQELDAEAAASSGADLAPSAEPAGLQGGEL